jgi:hypothetical protein
MRRLSLSIPALLLAIAVLAPQPVGAFELSGCTLTLTSKDASGVTVDEARSGRPDASQSDPLQAPWGGTVEYEGSTPGVIHDYTYSFSIYGVPTPAGGSSPNDENRAEGDGAVSVGGASTFRVAGLYYVSGRLTGEGGSCSGSAWVRVLGDPAGTIPWFLGIVLVILGALGLAAGARGYVTTSILGGFALGLGLDLLLISYAAVPFGAQTPIVVLALMTAIGVAIGLIGRRARRRREVVPLEGRTERDVTAAGPPAGR